MRRFCDIPYYSVVEGAVASWLVRSTPERAVRVRVLAGDIVLCSWPGSQITFHSQAKGKGLTNQSQKSRKVTLIIIIVG